MKWAHISKVYVFSSVSPMICTESKHVINLLFKDEFSKIVTDISMYNNITNVILNYIFNDSYLI